MHKYIAPHKSGAHRTAGIALFRALLRRCAHAPLDDNGKTTCQNIVRNTFKQNRHNQSRVELRKAFSAGFEALELLRSAKAGSAQSTSRISSLLGNAPHRLKESPKVPLLPKPIPKPTHQPLNPDPSDILARPRVSVSGKRRVPVFASADNYPFLRLKKPQPHRLGAYLRRKIKRRLKRHEVLQGMYGEITRAKLEDQWDLVIDRDMGIDPMEHKAQVNWVDALWLAVREILARLRKERERSLELMQGMEGVVRKERELAVREKEEQGPKS